MSINNIIIFIAIITHKYLQYTEPQKMANNLCLLKNYIKAI